MYKNILEYLWVISLLGFSVFAIQQSGQIFTESATKLSTEWYMNPGLFPLASSLFLLLLSLITFLKKNSRSIFRLVFDKNTYVGCLLPVRKMGLLVLVLLVYIGLLDWVNYYALTALFVFAMMWSARFLAKSRENIWLLILIAILASASIGLFFGNVMSVILP